MGRTKTLEDFKEEVAKNKGCIEYKEILRWVDAQEVDTEAEFQYLKYQLECKDKEKNEYRLYYLDKAKELREHYDLNIKERDNEIERLKFENIELKQRLDFVQMGSNKLLYQIDRLKDSLPNNQKP